MTILVVMGVSGSGKTTVAKALADTLGWRFCEGDSLHSEANIEKMARGVPLNDEDRKPWLQSLRQQIDEYIARGESAVVTCSALKQSYRDLLTPQPHQVTFVYLKGSPTVLRQRMAQRSGHYMPVDLLESQLATLEEPEDAITVDVDQGIDSIVHKIVKSLPPAAK